MVTPRELPRHELIGLEAEVAESTNPDAVGIAGVVVDESRNTLTLRTKKGEKSLVKEQCVFSFKLPSGERVKVDGKLLVARPEDRIKKKLKKW